METNKHGTSARKLSIKRLLIAILVIIAISYFSFSKVQNWQENKTTSILDAWFAPYVDVTAFPTYEFTKLGNNTNANVILSFIVASESDPCLPTWGNAYTLEQAGIDLDLDRRIARLRQLGGEIAISFGGLLNNELAISCTDTVKLQNAYQAVIGKYKVETIDLDIEGSALNDEVSLTRRAITLAKLQKETRDKGENLAIWLTLPVAPSGLTEAGTDAVATMLNNGVDLAGVNIMTMDYGQSKSSDQSMSAAAMQSLIETHRQLGIIYDQSGTHLSQASLWKKIGATPMIGQNDVLEEVFSLDDAANLNDFIIQNNIVRTSMWSANRDIQCGENYVNVSVVSDSCSGVKQQAQEYLNILSTNLKGRLQQNANAITESDPVLTVVEDDPDNSPYPIWSEQNVYLQGTKVVWHSNVYMAKWWTQGDLPDNPTLQSYQTPWQLIGPVLPGEVKISQATLPKDTYPEWSGKEQYDSGEIILFEGVPYKAKWWTQGDSPAAASSNPTSSPWIALTQAEIKKIIARSNE